MEFYVYQLRVEGEELPFYVGKGKGQRAFIHYMPCGQTDNNKWKVNTINKARKEGKQLLVEFLHKGLGEQEAFDLEIHYINKFGRKCDGSGCLTNLTEGGEGSSALVFSEEAKRKLGEAAIKRFKGVPKSDEHKEKLKKHLVEMNRSEEGRLRSAERMSKNLKGKLIYANPETKEVKRFFEGEEPNGFFKFSNRWGFFDQEMRKRYPKSEFYK